MSDPRIREVRPGGTITVEAIAFPASQTLQLRLINILSGAIAIAATSTGIVESSPGNYAKALTIPTNVAADDYAVEWSYASTWYRDDDTIRVTGSAVAIRPSVEEVATLLRARTKDKVSNEVGTFNADTRPTGTEVEELIDTAVSDIAMRVGAVPSALEDVAREAVTLRTAASVERSYFPEQATQNNSAYDLFRQDYLDLIDRIIEASFDPLGGAKGVVAVPLTTTEAAPYVALLPEILP